MGKTIIPYISENSRSVISSALLLTSLALPASLFAANKTESLPNQITTSNTSLASNNVLSILVDSSNVVWLGTDKGLTCVTASGWLQYNTDNHLKSNKVNDLALDKTASGTTLLVSTDGGLTAATYNTGGITTANTYTSANSGLVGTTVKKAIVDKNHTWWIATEKGINILKGTKWTNLLEGKDSHDYGFDYANNPITDLQEQPVTGRTLISTQGKGVVRMSYNDVDGVTGASTHGNPWFFRYVKSFNGEEYDYPIDTINAVETVGENQWYATNYGVYLHIGFDRYEGWQIFTTNEHMIDRNIKTVHVDKNGNLWVGTDKGISIVTPNMHTYQYTKAEGLINNSVNVITSDKAGNVWIGTAGGAEWTSKIMGTKVSSNVVYSLGGSKVKVFPNPSSDFVRLDFNFSEPQNISATLFNLNGQAVGSTLKTKASKGTKVSIPVSNRSQYPKGIYLLKVKGEDFNEILKVNIQ